MEGKPWYYSKTLWANLILFAVGVLDLVSQQPFIPPDWAPCLVLAISILNLALRLMTDKPLTLAARQE